MSFRPLAARVAKVEACAFCRFRASQPVRRYAAPRIQQQMTPAQMRRENDLRNRGAFLKLMKSDGLLQMTPREAEALIKDFLSADKDMVDLAANIQRLTTKYKLKVGDIANLAIPMFRIPDFYAGKARLPPSEHPAIGARLLLACSAAKDPSATLQILAAVYHRENDAIPQASDIARLFSPAEIERCMKMMEQLAEEGDAGAMTLHGQFLERSGKTGPAKYWYRRAVENCEIKLNPKYPHPMCLPRESPWIVLADRSISEKTPEGLAEAKAALEKGSFKADDPLAYYKLAGLEKGWSPKWFRYMSKAAASGHIEAAYKLGHYFMNVAADPSSYMNNSQIKRAFKFAANWRPGSVALLGKEWFTAAATGGHKPAMLELAELYSAAGEDGSAAMWLRRITEPLSPGQTEKWPQLVEQTRKRLLSVKYSKPKSA